MTAKLCNVCNIRRVYTGSKGTEIAPRLSEMCNYCFEEGGWENAHSDSNHDAIMDSLEDVEYGKTNHKSEAEYRSWLKEQHLETDACWICHPELNLAKLPAKKGNATTKDKYVRRPQFNHKGHSHPQTPAARRACKEAFWAQTTVNSYSVDQLAAAQATWNYSCDGFGKKTTEPAKKGGWAGVAPLGPKGGTGASVKAAGAKVKAINAKK